MKNILKVTFMLFLIGILFMSCNQEPNAPVVVDEPSQVLMKPDNGTEIFRFSDYSWFVITDWDAGLRVHIGIPNMDICTGGLNLFDFQYLILPNNNPDIWDRIMVLAKGDNLVAHVRPWPHTYPSNCEYYAAVLPIASGPVKFVQTDNDIDAWGRDTENANSYGWRVHGKLVGPEGKVYNLSAYYKVTWKGYFEFPGWIPHIKFMKEDSKINFH